MKALVSLFGIITIVFLGLGSVPVYADTTSFMANMQKYAGRDLNGDELKDILIGNTLYESWTNNNHKMRKVWIYFKNEKTIRSYHDSEMKKSWKSEDRTRPWRASGDGTLCFESIASGIGTEICWNHVRFEEGILKMKGLRGQRDRAFTPISGNQKAL